MQFPWKLYKTLFLGHAQHVLTESHFSVSKLSKSSHWPQLLSEKRKLCAFFENCTKRSFQLMPARFGQIAFLSVKVKIVMLASNSLQIAKTVRYLWKLYKTLFSGHAQHVLTKSHFSVSKLSKSSHWPQILFKKRKLCAFHENCTKRPFQVMPRTFWPNRIFEHQSSQIRHTGLKFWPKL